MATAWVERGRVVTEVVTGEAVVLEVPCARFPSRLLALIIDLLIQGTVLFGLFVFIVAALSGGSLNGAAAPALTITVTVAVIVGYPVVWETLTRGRSPGKFALGLRVVSDDGGPERFRQALVRGLLAVVEIWSLIGVPAALITAMVSARGKRLGDLFAGTFVIQQRLPGGQPSAALPVLSPQLAAWAAGLEMSGLSEQTAETARRYLARAAQLAPAARDELGARIAASVAARVSPPPPPGLPAEAFLGAVLTERRNRERARLLAAAGPPHGTAPTAQGTSGAREGTGLTPQRAGIPPPAWVGDLAQPEEWPGGAGAGFVPPA